MKDELTNFTLTFYFDDEQGKWVQREKRKFYYNDNINKVGGIVSVEFIDSIDLENEDELR